MTIINFEHTISENFLDYFFLGQVKLPRDSAKVHLSMRLHKFSKPSFGHISANFHRIELKLMRKLEIIKVIRKNSAPWDPITTS
jgi:hypothetical protein